MMKNPLDLRVLFQDLSYLRDNVEKLNQTWTIPDPPVQSSAPIIGPIITFLRRVTRRLLYWLMRPFRQHQTTYNRALADSLSDILRILTQIIESDPRRLKIALSGEESIDLSSDVHIIQMVSVLKYGDAVGNEVIAIQDALSSRGITVQTYSHKIDQRIPLGAAKYVWEMPQLRESDIIILHYTGESLVLDDMLKQPCKKILRYHNITPPDFYQKYDKSSAERCSKGYQEVARLIADIDACLPVSTYNAKCLEGIGYKCPMQVVPIIIPFDDYKRTPNQEIIDRYANDEYTNFLFLGRVVPNKKIEDVILSFHEYKRIYNTKSRLFLVGSFNEGDAYYQVLRQLTEENEIKDVVFTGHIPFEDILAYYAISDMFVCMSEHEGFCVPLVEAMYFNIPIIAYSSTAIPDTIGNGGVLVSNKDHKKIAEVMNSLITDELKKASVIMAQKRLLCDLQEENVVNELISSLQVIIPGFN